jgi:hypothetical protein
VPGVPGVPGVHTKSRNPVTLSVIHPHRNPSDSTVFKSTSIAWLNLSP